MGLCIFRWVFLSFSTHIPIFSGKNIPIITET
jgi:hypothetical protein